MANYRYLNMEKRRKLVEFQIGNNFCLKCPSSSFVSFFFKKFTPKVKKYNIILSSGVIEQQLLTVAKSY